MARISATEAALTGFRFVSHNIKTIAIWAGAYLVTGFVFTIALVVGMGPSMNRLTELSATQQESPQESFALLGQIAPLMLILMLAGLAFYAVLFATMNRAMLRPEDDRHAYLRLGADERRQFLLMLLSFAVGVGLYLAAIIAAVVIGLGVGLAARLVMGDAGVAIGVAVGLFAGFGALLYLWVRLSLAPSLTFDTGRVNLFGSWPLTKGRFWPIFATYLLVWLLALLIVLLTLIIIIALVAVSGGSGGIQEYMRPDFSSLDAYLTPTRILVNIVSIVLGVILWPVLLMPTAHLYAQITRGDDALTSPAA